ncbi:MAG: helix-turn-helix domain-containing protein [Nitrospiraceae bacterium]|nr:MAG: helix-turn-helix domain-containing protein [Nitrospiraceae bacterium]
MQKISSGIGSFDRLIDSFYIGDNVVWEVDSGAPYKVFLQNFIRQSFDDSQKIIYISFNRSPQSILKSIKDFLNPEHFTLVDGFTSGKGKNDKTFARFYETPSDINIVKIDDPKSIEQFTRSLNAIEDSLAPGARYIFDSLTGMQDLWSDENSTYKFFTYMCPRLYDLDTVAYWILDKEAHSQKFKANLRHITQVAIELYERRDMLYMKALKLDRSHDREAFKPHIYEINEGNVIISLLKKEPILEIGSRLKDMRTRRGMSQKELADSVDVSPSFISQVENNQISPSLSSFVLLCNALGESPAVLLDDKSSKKSSWLIKQRNGSTRPILKEEGLSVFNVGGNGAYPRSSVANIAVLEPHALLRKHFLLHKGKEFIHVLKGEVSLIVNGVEESIGAGDSVFLKDEIPSLWKNEMAEPAELLIMYM